MNFTLDRNDHKNLFGFAHAALTDSKNANKPFDLNQEIKDLYEALKDDQAYAIGLVQAYPSQLYMALGHTRELSKYHISKGLSTDELLDLAEQFEDINAVVAYLNLEQTDIDAIKAVNNRIQNEVKKPVEVQKSTSYKDYKKESQTTVVESPTLEPTNKKLNKIKEQFWVVIGVIIVGSIILFYVIPQLAYLISSLSVTIAILIVVWIYLESKK